MISDVITRYASARNPDGATFLNTGTDEHGLKIQRAAESAGMEPKEFCDQISSRFKVRIHWPAAPMLCVTELTTFRPAPGSGISRKRAVQSFHENDGF